MVGRDQEKILQIKGLWAVNDALSTHICHQVTNTHLPPLAATNLIDDVAPQKYRLFLGKVLEYLVKICADHKDADVDSILRIWTETLGPTVQTQLDFNVGGLANQLTVALNYIRKKHNSAQPEVQYKHYYYYI